jgi:hypothetical protein
MAGQDMKRTPYNPPILTARQLGLDETPCAGCGHPAWQHWNGELTGGVEKGGVCHEDACACQKLERKA